MSVFINESDICYLYTNTDTDVFVEQKSTLSNYIQLRQEARKARRIYFRGARLHFVSFRHNTRK